MQAGYLKNFAPEMLPRAKFVGQQANTTSVKQKL